MQRIRWLLCLLSLLLLCGCAVLPGAEHPQSARFPQAAISLGHIDTATFRALAMPEELERYVQLELLAYQAVVQATVQQREMLEAEQSGQLRAPRSRYLLHVEQMLGGAVPELPPSHLMWMESCADELQVGGRYILILGKTDSLPDRVYYSGGFSNRLYWQVLPDGRLRPCPYLQTFPQLDATNLPRTRHQLMQYLQPLALQRKESAAREGIIRGYDVQKAVDHSDVILWGTVIGPTEVAVGGNPAWEKVAVTLHRDRMLKGDAAPGRAELSLAVGRVQRGGNYLFLLRGGAVHVSFAADELGAIPAEDTQTVRQVYEALGLEMPEE